MRKLLTSSVLAVVFLGGIVNAQVRLSEDFESGSVPELPAGWTVWNAASFPIDPTTNWTVRDTGQALPGLATGLSQAHSGMRAVGVSWWSSIDTNTNAITQSNAWLITRRITGIQAGDSLRFWATGGTTSYLDSLQIWIGDVDSTPASQVFQLGSIIWPVGSTYGLFRRYAYDLSLAAGLDIFVGFRYYMDCAVDGFFVHVDDVSVGGLTSINPISSEIPEDFGLSQNYPNPFNPTTTIEFLLPSQTYTVLKVYNSLGAEVASLISEELPAGRYATSWDAQGVASGVYYYRLMAGNFVATKRLVLLK